MARPVRMLDSMSPGAAPAYAWTTVRTSALVLGRLAADPALDEVALAAEGITVVRRSSGGGPVLWDRDLLALDVVLPRGHPLAVEDVVEAYRWLGEAIAEALRELGAGEVEVIGVDAARAARRSAGPEADACFGGLSPFEVLAQGRKVVGLSQARRRTGALLQAGIPLTFDAERLARLMGRDRVFAEGLASVACGLDDVLPGVWAAEVMAAVDAAVCRRQGVRMRDEGNGE